MTEQRSTKEGIFKAMCPGDDAVVQRCVLHMFDIESIKSLKDVPTCILHSSRDFSPAKGPAVEEEQKSRLQHTIGVQTMESPSARRASSVYSISGTELPHPWHPTNRIPPFSLFRSFVTFFFFLFGAKMLLWDRISVSETHKRHSITVSRFGSLNRVSGQINRTG